jgi:hypothetical protein
MAQTAAHTIVREGAQPAVPVLRSVSDQELDERERAASDVVAEILSDGTVRPVVNPDGDKAGKGWDEGSICGRSWILWWTRRSFSQA